MLFMNIHEQDTSPTPTRSRHSLTPAAADAFAQDLTELVRRARANTAARLASPAPLLPCACRCGSGIAAETPLQAAIITEAGTRSRAFWLSVGPDAPEHRKTAAAAAYAEWRAAALELEALRNDG